MLRHSWEVTAASRIHATLTRVTLTWLEAQVLFWCIWKGASFTRLADFLDVRTDELRAAERSLLTKVAEAMGPVERELATQGYRRLEYEANGIGGRP